MKRGVKKMKEFDRLDPERCAALRRRFKAEIFSVCSFMHIRPDQLWGRDKAREIVKARKAFARELRNRGIPVETIGATIGRDHSSICSYLGKKKQRIYIPVKERNRNAV